MQEVLLGLLLRHLMLTVSVHVAMPMVAKLRELHLKKLAQGLVVLGLDVLGRQILICLDGTAHNRILVFGDEGVVFLGSVEPDDHPNQIEYALNDADLVLHDYFSRYFFKM